MSSFNVYDVGDSVTLLTSFTVGAIGSETPADPTVVKLAFLKPDGTTTSYTFGTLGSIIIRDSVGEYHAEIVIDTAGVWRYRWEGDTSVVAAEENAFQVRKQWVVA